MAEPHEGVYACRDEGTLVIRVVGHATMGNAACVQRHIEKQIEDGAQRLRLDMRACTMLDSTFIGMLLGVRKLVASDGDEPIALICPSDTCRKAIDVLRLNPLLPFCEESASGGPWATVLPAAGEPQQTQRAIAQAHDELACLPGAAGQTFRRIADQMKKELERREPGDA